jgi:hypothetical protein
VLFSFHTLRENLAKAAPCFSNMLFLKAKKKRQLMLAL